MQHMALVTVTVRCMQDATHGTCHWIRNESFLKKYGSQQIWFFSHLPKKIKSKTAHGEKIRR